MILMKKRAIISTVAIVMIMSFAATVIAQDVTIRIHGSSTVFPIAEQASNRYHQLHPEVDFDIGGGGSGTGIAMLINGEADIADMSRLPKASEEADAIAEGVNITVHTVAKDGIAICVHNDNPLTGLSIANITDIYNGTVTSWAAFGITGLTSDNIKVVERDENSGTHDFFNEFFLDSAEVPQAKVAAYQQTGSHPETVTILQTENNAIGYLGLAYVDGSVNDVPVDGVAPSFNTVKDDSYPVARGLYMVTDGVPTGPVGDFIDFIFSEEGQSIVYYVGYIPVGTLYNTTWTPIQDTPLPIIPALFAIVAAVAVTRKIIKR
jgi:phosphate transport system substrate-binding protein